MFLYLVVLILSVPVDSLGRPYPGGSRTYSGEFLGLPRQEEWTPNVVNSQRWRHADLRYYQEFPGSNIRAESFFTRNREPAPTAQYYGHNYGFMMPRREHQAAHDVKLQGIVRSSYTGSLPSFTHFRPDNAGHMTFHVPKYGTYDARGNRDRQEQLIVKVAGDEIRIRPEDYEIENRDAESKSEELARENDNLYPFIPFVKQPYPIAPNTDTFFATSISKESPSEDQYAVPEHDTPINEFGYYHAEHSDVEHPMDHQSQEAAESNDGSFPTLPKHFKEITQEPSSSIQNRQDLNAKVLNSYENWREVIINGQLQRRHGEGGSISERSFPLSIPGAQETPDLETEYSEEPWKLYPPLLIEEVNLETPESSDRQMPPGEAVTDGTDSKFTTHSSETKTAQTDGTDRKFTTVSSETEAAKIELDLFQIKSFSEGSGEEEPIEEEEGSEATDFLNVDSEEELVFDRKLSSDSSSTQVLEKEGSGLSSSEDRRQDVSREIFPRLIDVFASPNDTSTPCTTPKGEPGHCKDLRYCILHEILNNFNLYLQYACLIRQRFIGVCCPDNPVISHTPEPDEDTVTEVPDTETVEFDLRSEGCGMSTRTRIIGGFISKPHEWTWVVALLRKNRFFCGGVLINTRYVLTAAHCTLGVKPRDLKIRLGEYNVLESREYMQDIAVKEIKRHAQFITLTFQHDIALLKLKKPVEFSRYVSSICLPQANQTYSDVNATVVGWGAVSFGGAESSVLREVALPVWRNADCDRTYLLEDINDSFLCAGSPEPNQDACQGDSGGPLMALNDNGRWEAIGIVSWGRRCGDPNFPGVYTRVSTYLDWIQMNVN